MNKLNYYTWYETKLQGSTSTLLVFPVFLWISSLFSISCKLVENFSASHHLQFCLHNLMLETEKFPALCTICKMPWKFLLMLARKDREEIGIFLFEEGKNCSFWPKYISLQFPPDYFSPESIFIYSYDFGFTLSL